MRASSAAQGNATGSPARAARARGWRGIRDARCGWRGIRDARWGWRGIRDARPGM